MWRCVWYVIANFVPSLSSKLFHVRPVTQGDVYRAETEEIPRIFQVKTFFLSSFHSHTFAFRLDFLMSKYSDSVKRCSASEMFILAQICFDVALSLSRFRFCMPTRESAGRRPTWRRSLRVTRPTVSHTKATSSSPHYITSLPTVRPAPSLCGTSSSHLRPWSVAAATSSATRTTSTKRRMLLLLAKVKSSPWWSKLLMTQRVNLNVTLHG